MALISMIREKLVKRDQLLDDNRMSEAIALASFLPGPVAVNVVAFAGYTIAGIAGAVISIVAVLIPSFLAVLALSILYFEYESKLDFDSIMVGITPVIIGIIFSVAVTMARKNCKTVVEAAIAVVGLIVLFFLPGYWPVILVLVAAGLFGIFYYNQDPDPQDGTGVAGKTKYAWVVLPVIAILLVVRYAFPENINVKLFGEFSAVSLTLFGGGYVMVPVLQSLLVEQLQWLSKDEFIFGISIGQVTPGPILISAAFFGYKMNGIIGSVIATLGIFIPSSILMIAASRFYMQLKDNRGMKAALAGIRPAVTGLIFYSGFSLFFGQVKNNNIWFSLPLIVLAFLSIFRFNVSPVIVVIAGGVLGFLVNGML